MLIIAIYAGYAAVVAAMAMTLWRLVFGPEMSDRILALDTMTINAIALTLLYGLHKGVSSYFEAALLLAALGFVSTVALAKYLIGGDVIE